MNIKKVKESPFFSKGVKLKTINLALISHIIQSTIITRQFRLRISFCIKLLNFVAEFEWLKKLSRHFIAAITFSNNRRPPL